MSIRLKILQKMAQDSQEDAPLSPSSAPLFSMPAGVDLAWDPANLNVIKNLAEWLNRGLFVCSKGQLNLSYLDRQSSSVDASKYAIDQRLKPIADIALSFLTSFIRPASQKYYTEALTTAQRKEKIASLKEKVEAQINLGNIPGIGNLKQFLTNEIQKLQLPPQ